MKVRTDDKGVMFQLATDKEIELTWKELRDLETLIKVLRSITDQATLETALLKL